MSPCRLLTVIVVPLDAYGLLCFLAGPCSSSLAIYVIRTPCESLSSSCLWLKNNTCHNVLRDLWFVFATVIPAVTN